jgi:hypothetical protein
MRQLRRAMAAGAPVSAACLLVALTLHWVQPTCESVGYGYYGCHNQFAHSSVAVDEGDPAGSSEEIDSAKTEMLAVSSALVVLPGPAVGVAYYYWATWRRRRV